MVNGPTLLTKDEEENAKILEDAMLHCWQDFDVLYFQYILKHMKNIWVNIKKVWETFLQRFSPYNKFKDGIKL